MPTYAPLLAYSNKSIMMMKATSDPNVDGNWANIGGDVYFGQKSSGVKSMWSVEDGGDIHVATQEDDGRVAYHVFDPGTDTWTTKNEFVVTNTPDTANRQACSIALRSDGDVIVLYAGGIIAGRNDIFYARKETGTWTVNIDVYVAGVFDLFGAVAVLGASNRVHFFGKNDTNDRAWHRSLSSGNSLDTIDEYNFVVGSDDFIHGHGVSYLSGGNTKVRVPYLDSGDTVSFAEFDSEADPTITETTGVGDVATKLQNETGVHCASVDGTNVHWLHSRDSDADIFHDSNDDDAGWGVDDEEKDAVTCNRISCNVYNRSGQKLAYLYLDGATNKYGERDISGAPAARSRFHVMVG